MSDLLKKLRAFRLWYTWCDDDYELASAWDFEGTERITFTAGDLRALLALLEEADELSMN